MKALSIIQPWASLIAKGWKIYETRSWSTSYRGEIAIHSSKRWTKADREYLDFLRHRFPQIHPSISTNLPLGAVLCVCNLIDCIPTVKMKLGETLEAKAGDFSHGRYAWELEVVKVFDMPIPAKGQLGIWNWEIAKNTIVER